MAIISVTATVSDPDAALTLFDRIQVHRSESGSGGPYIEITAPSAQPAQIVGALGTGPGIFVNVLGLDLQLQIDGGLVQTIDFSALAPPSTMGQVAAFINGVLTGATAGIDGDGELTITTALTGTGATIKVVGGNAVPALGLQVDQFDNGESPRIIIVSGVFKYPFVDQSGDENNFYKTRFVSSISGALSDFSDPIQGTTGTIISAANLITAKVVLANMDGTPNEGQYVFLRELKTPLTIEGATAIGTKKTLVTDPLGRAETDLIRGSIVEFSIPGTQIARRITVPTVGTEFDLLDPVIATEDTFDIFVSQLPQAPRSTL